MRSNIKFLFILPLFAVLSCKDEFVVVKSSVVEMSGRWWVSLFYDADSDGVLTDADALIYEYADFGGPGIVTSNVANNAADTLLVNDHEDSWPFEARFPVDISSLTMKPTTGLPNMKIDGETVSIINGKVLKGAATSLSGNPVDSIVMTLEFSDDPGSYYIYSGLRYTGFAADDY